MTGSDIAKPDLVYNGEIIHAKADMLSLTDMWKAAGADPSKRPYEWSRKEGAAFVEAVALSLNTPTERIYHAARGKGGSTSAHWQIGLAYAKYLSPQFHMWCNTVVRERMEGRSTSGALVLDEAAKSAIGGIVKKCSAVVVREEAQALLRELLPMAMEALVAQGNFMVRRGRTANDIMLSYGFPKGVKSLSRWFGNRLDALGCRMNGNDRADIGGKAIRLYDPDKADVWMQNGGRLVVDQKLSERRGQTVFRLVPKHADRIVRNTRTMFGDRAADEVVAGLGAQPNA